tara:strand:- start:379 stop:1212 length:834 start_codon:yes stop_codon:yes gene_type:complete
MKLIRALHEKINEDSNLIIFCESKILYDHKQNSYIFKLKNLNSEVMKGPFLAITEIKDEFTYVLDINIRTKDQILGLYSDPEIVNFVDLINILTFLDKDSFLLVSRASILNKWNASNVFCNYCGNENEFDLNEGAFKCKCKKIYKYPSISPCIITLIYDDTKILLGRNKFFPPNMYSTLAGFIEAGENAEQALVREVKEEVNLEVSNIKYFSSQSWPFPSQLMLGFLCKFKSGAIVLNDKELEDAKWFNVDELPLIPPETSISGQLIRSYIEDHLKL